MIVRSYDVALDLTTGEDTFRSTTTVRFAARGPVSAELLPRRLRSASLNGVPIDSLALTGIEAENELVVVADMAYADNGQGVHRDVDTDGRTYVYACSAPDAAPRWFACFDRPDLKAPLRLSVRCPADWTVLGTGGTASFDGAWWRLPVTPPIPPYLAGFLAGPYHSCTAAHEGITLGVHARQSQKDILDAGAGSLLELTARLLDEFHELLGVRYPWGEYHQAFVPGLPWRGMENPGCVLYREPVLARQPAELFAHELAHMWFGDLVTMRRWDELWLQESFAEYLAHRVTGSHAALERGAAVLAQLARRIGDEVFVRGLRAHLAEPGNMAYDDFVRTWSAVVPEFAGWARRWFRTPGTDTLRRKGNRLLRTGSRAHRLSVAAFGPDGRELSRADVAVDGETTELPAFPADTALVLPNADNASWVKIRLRTEEWQRLPNLLPHLDETARRVLWTAVRHAVEDGELDPRSAIGIAAAALPRESSAAVLGEAAHWLIGVVLATYLPDAERERAEHTLRAALGLAIRTAPAGSALERAAARHWIDVAPVATLHSLRHPRARDRLRALTAEKETTWTFIIAGAPVEERYAAAKTFWQPAQRRATEPFVGRYFEEIVQLPRGIEAVRLARFAFPRTAGAPALATAERLRASADLDPGVRRAIADGAAELRKALAIRERLWHRAPIGNMVSPLVP